MTTSVAKAEKWSIVEAIDGQPWPCTIVDEHGRSLLAVHNGTPIVRSRDLAERVVRVLTSGAEPRVSVAPDLAAAVDAAADAIAITYQDAGRRRLATAQLREAARVLRGAA